MPHIPANLIRIVIVDDHPVVRAGLASMLGTQAELEVVGAASSGEDALRMVEEHHPDVLLLDLRMPGLSGVETLQALKAAGRSVRVIILTNYETDEDIYRAVQAGAQAQRGRGVFEHGKRYTCLEQRPKKHVAGDPGKAIECRNPHRANPFSQHPDPFTRAPATAARAALACSGDKADPSVRRFTGL